MKLYAILGYDWNDELYLYKISLNKEIILSEISNMTKEDSKGCGCIYLGELSIEDGNIYNTNTDFVLLEEWCPRFGTYGEWKHKVLI